jgi:tetratricopeptide (TPR) repeat protein
MGDKPFDGTLRVGFALRHRSGSGHQQLAASPEDLEVDWLGAYWKLPKAAMVKPDEMGADTIRDCIVSAARTSGTAPVHLAHCHEIYAALGDVVQRLFASGGELSSKDLKEMYGEEPELAAYMVARAGGKTKAGARRHLNEALKLLDEAEGLLQGSNPKRSHALSYIWRARFQPTTGPDGELQNQKETSHLKRSLDFLPTNATTLCLIGADWCRQGENWYARRYLRESLLLDPDFKAPYVYLGMVHLRLKLWQSALEISEKGRARHPSPAQFQYHIGVACCQLALEMAEKDSGAVNSEQYQHYRQRAIETLHAARGSWEAANQKQLMMSRDFAPRPPWTEEDDRMLEAMEKPQAGTEPVRIPLPENFGWSPPSSRS